MKAEVQVCMGLLTLVSGCLHEPPSGRVFTREWAAEAERVPPKSAEQREVVLVGEKGPLRTALRVSEEGKTSLSLGERSGLRTDINVHHGDPSVKVSYKWEW